MLLSNCSLVARKHQTTPNLPPKNSPWKNQRLGDICSKSKALHRKSFETTKRKIHGHCRLLWITVLTLGLILVKVLPRLASTFYSSTSSPTMFSRWWIIPVSPCWVSRIMDDPPPKYTAGFPIMKQHANVLTWWQAEAEAGRWRRFETLEKTNTGSRHFVGHIIWWDDLGNLRSWDSWDVMKISTKQISTGVYVLFGRTAFSFHTHLRGFFWVFQRLRSNQSHETFQIRLMHKTTQKKRG